MLSSVARIAPQCVAQGVVPVIAWAGQSGIVRMLDSAKAGKFVDQCWGDSIVPTLVEYIKIPNKSPAFDPDWSAHGYMEQAVSLFERWARERVALLPGAR